MTIDPDGKCFLAEIAASNAAKIKYADEKERGTLARSTRCRAAHTGFKVDQRRGGGYLSVRRIPDDSEEGKARIRLVDNERVGAVHVAVEESRAGEGRSLFGAPTPLLRDNCVEIQLRTFEGVSTQL